MEATCTESLSAKRTLKKQSKSVDVRQGNDESELSLSSLLPSSENRSVANFYSKVAELNANGELTGDETTEADYSEDEASQVHHSDLVYLNSSFTMADVRAAMN